MTAFNTSIAGINKHDGPNILDSIDIDEPLTLVREPKNRFDPNAVSVYYREHKLGYVPAFRAGVVAGIMDSGTPMHAKLIRSGFEPRYVWAEMRVYENESENKVRTRREQNKSASIITKDISVANTEKEFLNQAKATDSNGLTDIQRTFLLFFVLIILLAIISTWVLSY
jgi:hypothetical protein